MNNYIGKIYKITCSCCNKIYIGSCSNKKGLTDRLYNHHSDCNNGRTSKLYNHMREQGFDKFTILLIEEVEINNNNTLRQLENDKIQELDTINNGLNQRRAYSNLKVKKQKKKIADSKYNINNRNKINISVKKYRDNLPKTYICECCNYSVSRKDTYDRHCKSLKHLSKINLI